MNEEMAKEKLQKVVNEKIKEEEIEPEVTEITRLTTQNIIWLADKYWKKLPWILAGIDAFWDLVLKDVWSILHRFYNATKDIAKIEDMEDILVNTELKVMRKINKEDAKKEADWIEAMFNAFKNYVEQMKSKKLL